MRFYHTSMHNRLSKSIAAITVALLQSLVSVECVCASSDDPTTELPQNNRYAPGVHKRPSAQKLLRTVDACTVTLRFHPNDISTYKRRALAYSDLQQYQNAVDDFSQMLKLDSQNKPALAGRALIYDELGEHQKAIEDCDQLIKLDDNMEAAYLLRANQYLALQEYQKAISDYDNFFKFAPAKLIAQHGWSYWEKRAIAYNGAGQYEKALADLNTTIKHAPSGRSAILAYELRAEIFAKLKNYAQAIKNWNDILILDPDYFVNLYWGSIVLTFPEIERSAANSDRKAIRL